MQPSRRLLLAQDLLALLPLTAPVSELRTRLHAALAYVFGEAEG